MVLKIFSVEVKWVLMLWGFICYIGLYIIFMYFLEPKKP